MKQTDKGLELIEGGIEYIRTQHNLLKNECPLKYGMPEMNTFKSFLDALKDDSNRTSEIADHLLIYFIDTKCKVMSEKLLGYMIEASSYLKFIGDVLEESEIMLDKHLYG